MFESVKSVKIHKKTIQCYDLTYGFILDIQSGKVDENPLTIVCDGTDLSEDEVRELRGSEVTLLQSAILQLTYPEMYDEDGNLKDLTNIDEIEDKKKA